MNRTDAVVVTTADGDVTEWHASGPSGNPSTNLLATGQQHPDYPLPYAQSCDGGICVNQMTWLWETSGGNAAWIGIDFPN
jgi:hypothetical protein